jgi:hypothetical protein
MNFRTTIILLVLLAAGGVFVFVANKHASTTDTAPTSFDAKGKKLFDQKADDITKLAIHPSDAGAKTVVLSKQDGNWKLVQPVAWGADSFEARNLVDSIVDLRSQGGVDLDSANLSSTGLDHPRFTIEATDTTGKTTKLDVGNRSALGNDLYVKVGDDKSGQLVSGGSLADKLDKGLDKLADSLRDKQLVKVSSSTAKMLEVTHKDQKLSLVKEGEDWKIVAPRQAPADSSAVSDLLFAVTDLKADSYVDPTSPEVSDADFEHPKATIFLSASAPATQPAATQPAGTTITFGQFASVDRDKIYVKLSDPPIIARAAMTQSSLERITGASSLTLRDKKVLDIDPANVTSITLAIDHPSTTQPTTHPAEQSEFTLARRKEKPAVFGPLPAPATQPASTQTASSQPTTEPASQPAVASTQPASKWVVESGGSGDAVDADVDALLGALHPLTATKFLDMPPTTQPAGTYALTLHTGPASGKGPEDFSLRFTNPGATGSVIGSYQDLVFELDRAILDKLDAKFKAAK